MLDEIIAEVTQEDVENGVVQAWLWDGSRNITCCMNAFSIQERASFYNANRGNASSNRSESDGTDYRAVEQARVFDRIQEMLSR
jgi:hypothetical protein